METASAKTPRVISKGQRLCSSRLCLPAACLFSLAKAEVSRIGMCNACQPARINGTLHSTVEQSSLLQMPVLGGVVENRVQWGDRSRDRCTPGAYDAALSSVAHDRRRTVAAITNRMHSAA